MNSNQAKITLYIERNLSPKLGALRKARLAHATGPDLLDDPVVPDDGVLREINVRSGKVLIMVFERHRKPSALNGQATAL